MTYMGLMSKIYQKSINIKKTREKKNGQKTWIDIKKKKRRSDGQQAYEKMLNVVHQRNANQNYNEISPHTCQKGYKKYPNKF